jgi:hypothetical protein
MPTWSEIQQWYDDEAARRGIHVDAVYPWMLSRGHKCDECGTAQLPSDHALCGRCTQDRIELENSFRPEVIATRQGCRLVYSDCKEEAGPFNATTDKHGTHGLTFIGGV